MNITSLIQQHPLLNADLNNLGLGRTQIHLIANEIGSQLGGNRGFNLCQILASLTSQQFIRAIDTQRLADRAQLSPSLAQSIILLIAPWVDRFQLRAI